MRNGFLYTFLPRLEQAGIRYAIVRGWEDVPNSMQGGDCDMWVDKMHYEQLKQNLRQTLADNDGVVVSYMEGYKAPKYILLGPDWGLQLDLGFTVVHYKCYNYYSDELVQKHVMTYNGCHVVSTEADAYMAFIKEVLYNGYSQKEKYVTRMRNVLKSSSQEQIHDNLNVYSDSTIRMFQEQALDEKRTKYPELRKAMCKDIFPHINFRNMWYQLRKIKRIFRHPGYVIAVLGTDGSGKSAIIDSITPWLDEGFHHNVKYKHLRPGFLPDIAVLLGKRKESDCHPTVVSNPHVAKPSGFFGSLARLMYYLLDYSIGYFKLVWKGIALHYNVFIFDRYYYDYYIDQRRSLIKLPKWIIRVGEIFVPKPDIILCLGGDPETVYARKPETSLEEVTRQNEELKRFAAKRKNAIWIDTTQPIENSIHDVKSAILKMMSTRFKDVL